MNIRQSTSVLDKPNKYAASGLKNTLHGCIYQLKLLMLFLKLGLDNGYSFRLATEMDAAEKFDDLVFEYKNGGGSVYRFLQAKHKQDERSIEVRDLLTEDQDGEFRLAKYFASYRKIKKKPEFNGKNDEIKDFIICTNAGLSDALQGSFEQIAAQDDFLDLSFEGKHSKCLKLKVEKFPNKRELIESLEGASDINRLAKRLIECATGNRNIDLKDNLFKKYHVALANEIIDIKNKKFRAGFIDNDNLSEKAKKFREVLLAKNGSSQEEFKIKMKDISLKLSSAFGKGFRLSDNSQLTNSKEFAREIVDAIKSARNGVVKIKRELSKTGIIKDNINKLAGHVLIEKDDGEKDTYYFSSTFFDDSNVLPGNLGHFRSELKEELKNENIDFDKEEYGFHIANFQTCKEGQLHIESDLPDDHITKEEIESFFEKLVFAVDQPNEIELGKILEAKISKDFSEKFNYIGSMSRDAYNKFQIEVLNWMKEKEGRFLSNEEVKSFFMEAEQQISTLSIIEKEIKKANSKIDGVEKIVKSNNEILKHVHSITIEDSNKQMRRPIQFGMTSPAKFFTGRVDELKKLHYALQNEQSGVPSMACISGSSGIGKSELARNYAYTYAEKYYGGNILWMNAEEEEVLVRSFRELAKNKLEIRTIDANGQEKDIKDVVDDVYHYFRSMKSLFIFDNVDNYKSIKKFLPLELLLGDNIPCVLVTSCNREWKTEKNVSIQMQYLGGFSVKEAEEFIRKALDISDRSQSDEVGRLAKNEQYFPLALQEAVSYINRRRLVTKDFWIEGYLKEYAKEAELLNSSNFQRIEASSITLKITLNRIGKNEDCGRKALEILNIMAYFAANNLPSAIFFLGLTEDQKELTSEAIKLLCQYSVISINVDNILGIHRLVQKMIRLELKEKKMEVEVLKQAFKLLKKTFSDSTRNIYKIDCLLLEHLQVFRSYICNLLKENGVDKKNIEKTYLKDLLIWEAQIYGQYRDIQKQKNLLKEALFISPEDPIIKAKLAVVFENLGDYKEQKEYLEQALFVFKKTGEQDDLQIAIIEAKLGRAYGNLGQYDEQKEYIERALDVFEKLDKQDDLRVATVKLELGKAYGNLRKYNKKKEYLEQALSVFDKRYSPEFSEFQYYSIFWKHPVFLWTKYGLDYDLLEGYHLFSALQMIDLKVELSRAYESLGEYEKQNKCLYDVLLSFKKYYVFNDLRVAIIELEMARSYGNLGLRFQQVGCLNFVKEVFIKRCVQEINPFQVAIVKLELGRAYRSLRMYDEQKNELEQALDLCEKYQDIDALQVAFIKAELGAISAYFDGKRDYLEQALDIFEEYYYHDDRGAIDELKKKLYEDKFQLNRDEKLSALKRQRRLLEKQFPVLKNFREGDNVPISSGSVELDEAYEKSLKYGALQYAITLKSIAKIKRDTNMESNKKNSFASYIMMMNVAKAVLKKYYGVCHFYYAVTTIRLSVYNSEFQHISFLSEEDFVEALDVLKLHYNCLSEYADMPVRLPELNFMHQKSEVSVEECLPNTSYRKKRESESECLFTWKDVDEFNEEKDEIRDLSKIKIDSKKFIRYLKNLPEEKRSQLIKLASEVKIGDNSQGLMSKLISNQKVMNHLGRVGKISGMTMHGMMAKNILADFLNGNYQGVAINVGFIAGGQGFAKVAETASLKGLKLAAEGKLLVGSSLRAASPFLARGTSAFVIYDLVNQVKAFKNGTEEALVGIVGDSIYLGVDAAEIGIEVAEAFEVLEGVSSVTGPIGAAVGAVVFVGTDIYTAVKRVDKIDQIIHLKGIEKFFEGLRAFIGMQPEQNIEELLEEKQLDNQLVNQGLEYLKQHNDIQRYVFPSGRIVKDFCQYILYNATRCVRTLGLDGGRCLERRIVTGYDYKCTNKFEADLDNAVLLDRENPEIKWNRARPDDPSGGKVFCLPQGDYEPTPSYGSYSCKNAIGVTDLSPNKIEGHTLINLGEGEDYAKGFLNSPNIFVVNNGSKKYYGGNKDDIFVLQADYVKGYLSGQGGINTLDTTLFAFQEEPLNIELHIGKVADSFLDNWFKICEVNQVIGRENKADIITVSCNGCNSNVKLIDGRGGNERIKDKINIIDDSCSYQMQIIVRANTAIYNQALEGNFDYLVPLNDGGSVGFGFIYDPGGFNVNNTFWFAYEAVDIRSIDVSCVNVLNVTRHQVEFNFVKSDKEFNVTVLYPENYSYRLGNNIMHPIN